MAAVLYRIFGQHRRKGGSIRFGIGGEGLREGSYFLARFNGSADISVFTRSYGTGGRSEVVGSLNEVYLGLGGK